MSLPGPPAASLLAGEVEAEGKGRSGLSWPPRVLQARIHRELGKLQPAGLGEGGGGCRNASVRQGTAASAWALAGR